MSTVFEKGRTPGSGRPVIGTMIGDPAGIGPEVVVRALAGGTVHEVSIPVIVGSTAAVERAIEFTGVAARVRSMKSFESPSDDPAIIDVIDSGALPADE